MGIPILKFVFTLITNMFFKVFKLFTFNKLPVQKYKKYNFNLI